MKNLLLSTLTFLAISILGCTSGEADVMNDSTNLSTDPPTQSLDIGEYGTSWVWHIDLIKMLQAFNNVSTYTATAVTIFSSDSLELDLMFLTTGGGGQSIELTYNEATDIFIMNAPSGGATGHTCSGNPCSSCDFVRNGWGFVTGCKCLEAGQGNKCNHTISGGSMGVMSGDPATALIDEYNSL